MLTAEDPQEVLVTATVSGASPKGVTADSLDIRVPLDRITIAQVQDLKNVGKKPQPVYSDEQEVDDEGGPKTQLKWMPVLGEDQQPLMEDGKPVRQQVEVPVMKMTPECLAAIARWEAERDYELLPEPIRKERYEARDDMVVDVRPSGVADSGHSVIGHVSGEVAAEFIALALAAGARSSFVEIIEEGKKAAPRKIETGWNLRTEANVSDEQMEKVQLRIIDRPVVGLSVWFNPDGLEPDGAQKWKANVTIFCSIVGVSKEIEDMMYANELRVLLQAHAGGRPTMTKLEPKLH